MATNKTTNKSHPEYVVWQDMRRRCYDQKRKYYDRYGGRGIRFCERWGKFENFFADMGPRPSPAHQLDRIDNNADYSPLNCRWATPTEQARNKSNNLLVTISGRTQCLSAWAEESGLGRATIARRLAAGWPDHLLLSKRKGDRVLTPRTSRIVTVAGFSGPMAAAARRFGISKSTLKWRLNSGMSAQDAVQKDPHPRVVSFLGETLSILEWAKRYGINHVTLASRLDAGWPVERAITQPARKKAASTTS